MLKSLASLLLSLALIFQQGMGPGPGTPAASGVIAIALDAATVTTTASIGVGSPMTYTATVSSGTNRMGLAWVRVVGSGTPSVTCAGAAMTQISSSSWNFGADHTYWFAIVAPASGSDSIVVSLTATMTVSSSFLSYTGAFQSTTMDAIAMDNTNSSGGPPTARTISITTIASNDWLIAGSGSGAAVSIAPGTGLTLRSNTGQPSATMDSNGPVASGSNSVTVTFGSTAVSQSTIVLAMKHA